MTERSTFTVHVVTPDGIVYDHETALAVLHTPVGELGIMAHHVPLLASLTISEVRVKTGEAEFDEIAVSGGFAEFSENMLTIVANSAERKDQIDAARAQRAKERAEKRISHAKEVHDTDSQKRAEVSLARAVNRLSIVKH